MATREAAVLTDELFLELVEAASLAPSSDNMQPWEFRKRENSIEVYCAEARLLTIDVENMFTWISIGAAVQNLVNAAAAHGLLSVVEYTEPEQTGGPAAVVRFSPGRFENHLAEWIPHRKTNRRPFESKPLEPALVGFLNDAVKGIDASVYWITGASELGRLAEIDTEFNSILLEHKPFFDGLFDTIRFTRREIEAARLGMDLRSLEIPYVGYLIARLFRRRKLNRIIGRLGIGRVVAKILSSRLRRSGAVTLVAARSRDPTGFMEAGRAMEQLWLAGAAKGLSEHPYGVIPQYLTMAELKPEMFSPQHLRTVNDNRGAFHSCFPATKDDVPAAMLRIGRARRYSPRNDVRLLPYQIIRDV